MTHRKECSEELERDDPLGRNHSLPSRVVLPLRELVGERLEPVRPRRLVHALGTRDVLVLGNVARDLVRPVARREAEKVMARKGAVAGRAGRVLREEDDADAAEPWTVDAGRARVAWEEEARKRGADHARDRRDGHGPRDALERDRDERGRDTLEVSADEDEVIATSARK